MLVSSEVWMKLMKRFIAVGMITLISTGWTGYAGTLTSSEIAQIQQDLGITLSQQEIDDLGAIVKPDTSPVWRTDAESRIDLHRRAALSIRVEDSEGTPVPGAQVDVHLSKSGFKFGGVANAVDFTDANNNLGSNGQTTGY